MTEKSQQELFGFTTLSSEEAAKILNAQKVLMHYTLEGLEHLTALMLETPTMDEFQKIFTLYEEVTAYTVKVSNVQSVEEAQKITEEMQASVRPKLEKLLHEQVSNMFRGGE